MRFGMADLQLFLNIAETGSITAGAERSYLALASASARVKAMEEELGASLLTRGRRGVEPTPAGRALLRHARIIVDQVERMRGDLGQYAKGLKGHVRLVCNTTTLTEYLPEALSGFLTLHPHVDIDLRELMSSEIVAEIFEGRADVGILGDSADTTGLQTYPFHIDRKVLIASPSHPLAKRKSVALSETLQYGFVGLAEDSSLQKFLAGHAARAGGHLAYRVRMRNFDDLCRMVAQNVGLGIIPETAAKRARERMDLRLVRITDAWASRQLTICVRDFDSLPTHARELVLHLKT